MSETKKALICSCGLSLSSIKADKMGFSFKDILNVYFYHQGRDHNLQIKRLRILERVKENQGDSRD